MPPLLKGGAAAAAEGFVSDSIPSTKSKEADDVMSTPPNQKIFVSGAKENAGIAALCRGFLTKTDGKRSGLARDANKSAVSKKDGRLPRRPVLI